MFDRFNQKTRELFRRARSEAQRHGHDYLGTGHLLLAILNDPTGGGRTVSLLGVDGERLRVEVNRLLPDPKDPATLREGLTLPFTPRLKQALSAGDEFAKRVGQDWISVVHVLAGLVSIQEGVACRAVVGSGGRPSKILAAISHAAFF